MTQSSDDEFPSLASLSNSSKITTKTSDNKNCVDDPWKERSPAINKKSKTKVESKA